MKQFFSHPVVSTTLKVAVSILLLGGLIYYINLDDLITSLQNANSLYLIIGFGLAVLQLIVHFYRWRYLLRIITNNISNKDVITSLLVGFTAGFFTPAQLGEFAGRVASVPNVNKSHVIGITVIDKLYWAALTFIIGGTGLTLFIANYGIEYWHSSFQYIIIIALAAIAVIFLFPKTIKDLLKFLPDKIRNHRFYEMILVIENKLHNTNGRILFGLTFLLYAVILTEYYFLTIAFAPVSFINVIICASSVFFVKAVIFPISFGDLGVRESAAVFFFEKVGTSAAVAFSASLVMSFANIIIPAAIGALLVTRLKRK
ncbi:MAG: lysylphosphatidylglycerol synthase transmembrane domain-containing protein [Bacteroidota bacterium]